jgi:hypothetical protein
MSSLVKNVQINGFVGKVLGAVPSKQWETRNVCKSEVSNAFCTPVIRNACEIQRIGCTNTWLRYKCRKHMQKPYVL